MRSDDDGRDRKQEKTSGPYLIHRGKGEGEAGIWKARKTLRMRNLRGVKMSIVVVGRRLQIKMRLRDPVVAHLRGLLFHHFLLLLPETPPRED